MYLSLLLALQHAAHAEDEPAPTAGEPAPSGEEPAPSGEEPAPSGGEPAPTTEPSGYRDVELKDNGPTVMDDKRDYKNILVPGFSALPPGLKLRYYRLVDPRFSLVLGAGFASLGASAEGESDLDPEASWTRWHLLGGFDYLPVANGFHGFYLGGRVLLRQGTTTLALFDDGSSEESVRRIAVLRALIGYSVVWDPGVHARLGVGFGYRQDVGETLTGTDYVFASTVPTLEFNLGWAF